MTQQVTVAPTTDARARLIIAQVVASLPVSLRSAAARSGLAAVTGDSWSRSGARAVEDGASGVMILAPGLALDTAALDEIRRAGVPVVVDTTWSYNPAVGSAAPHLMQLADEDASVETRVEAPAGSNLDEVALAQLGLVRSALGDIAEFRIERWNVHGYEAVGRLASGSDVAFSAILTNARRPHASIRLLTRRAAVRVELPDTGTATCGSVIVSDETGAVLLPTSFETAHRAAWRELHGRVVSGSTSSDFEELLEDIKMLTSAR